MTGSKPLRVLAVIMFHDWPQTCRIDHASNMTIRFQQIVILLCLLPGVFDSGRASAQSGETQLVTIESGDLPIILSAPHGGRLSIPGVAQRRGVGVSSFQPKPDTNSDKLTEHLADALEERVGKRPYLVIARFHRKYLDANRLRRDAYESQEAKVVYDIYHRALSRARQEVMERWGRGILLDVHGQAAEPRSIFRGTQNGKTATHLVNRFGREALIGPRSLFGQLARQGVPVYPNPDSNDREHDKYDGGYIVRNYGSSSFGTVDAIQLELGRELRSTKAIPSTAAKLADAIAAFANVYLPRAQRNAPVDNGRDAGAAAVTQE